MVWVILTAGVVGLVVAVIAWRGQRHKPTEEERKAILRAVPRVRRAALAQMVVVEEGKGFTLEAFEAMPPEKRAKISERLEVAYAVLHIAGGYTHVALVRETRPEGGDKLAFSACLKMMEPVLRMAQQVGGAPPQVSVGGYGERTQGIVFRLTEEQEKQVVGLCGGEMPGPG